MKKRPSTVYGIPTRLVTEVYILSVTEGDASDVPG